MCLHLLPVGEERKEGTLAALVKGGGTQGGSVSGRNPIGRRRGWSVRGCGTQLELILCGSPCTSWKLKAGERKEETPAFRCHRRSVPAISPTHTPITCSVHMQFPLGEGTTGAPHAPDVIRWPCCSEPTHTHTYILPCRIKKEKYINKIKTSVNQRGSKTYKKNRQWEGDWVLKKISRTYQNYEK